MGTAQVPFGTIEDVALLTLRGKRSTKFIVWLGEEIAKLLGMAVDHGPVIRQYPNEQGDGGVGVQIYWAWTDSFLVIGTWPELNLVRIYCAACKEYSFKVLADFLELTVGPVVTSHFKRM